MRPFPSAPSAGKWPVSESESGAKFPVWSRNRRELFYVNSDNRIMVVRYTANDHSFVPEKPRQWSPAPLFRPTNNAPLESGHSTGWPALCSARSARIQD